MGWLRTWVRKQLPEVVPRYVGKLGVLLAVSLLYLEPPVVAALTTSSEWQWDAFGALGTMAGFSLAALTLVVGLRSSDAPATRELLSTPAGAWMVGQILRSVWAWSAPAALALLANFVQSPILVAAFIGACLPAVCEGGLALLAFHTFFKRYAQTRKD